MSAVIRPSTADIRALIRAHKRWDALFGVLGILSLMVGILTLAALFVGMLIDGVPRLNGEFFSNFPSRRAADAGILSACTLAESGGHAGFFDHRSAEARGG